MKKSQIELPQLKASNVTDPDFIGHVRLELLAQDIPFLLRLMKFHVILLRSAANAGQSHLLHQLCHIFRADLMSSLSKNSADLFGAQHLTILIKHFTDQSAILLSSLFEPSIAPFIAEDVVIEGSAGDIHSFTKSVYVVLAV